MKSLALQSAARPEPIFIDVSALMSIASKVVAIAESVNDASNNAHKFQAMRAASLECESWGGSIAQLSSK